MYKVLGSEIVLMFVVVMVLAKSGVFFHPRGI